MFLQDGIDKYNGVMRFLREHEVQWDIRIDRLAPNWDQPQLKELPSFSGIIADGLSTAVGKKAYTASRIPLVAIDWFDRAAAITRSKTVRIDSDSVEIGEKAAETVLKTGPFASYAFLPQPDRPSWSTERGNVFSQEMQERGIDVRPIDPSAPLGAQLRALPKPTAIFAAPDTLAAQALRAARAVGIAIPDDLSILGVDNERLTCLHTDPPLATIQPDFEQAGFLAAEALDRLLRKRSTRKRLSYQVKTVVMRQSLEPPGTAGKLVQRAQEIIRNQAVTCRTIDSIARQLGVSRRLLDRRFRQITGRSVLDMLQEQRMSDVRTLLRTTDLPISEICASCAFGSGTYPQRLFKKLTGLTMHAYRILNRKHAPA